MNPNNSGNRKLVAVIGVGTGLILILSIIFWFGMIPGQVKFEHPFDVAVTPDGRIVVADTLDNRIMIFDSEGKLQRSFGSEGNDTGQFRFPQSVAVSPDGNIFVVDGWNNRIQIFDQNGTFLKTWGSKGYRDGELDSPHGIAVTPEGNVIVTERENNRVQVFDRNGTFKRKWGATGPAVDVRGIYNKPNSAVSRDGNVVQLAEGRIINTWDSFEDIDDYSFNNPNGVAINRSGDIIIADTFDNRISAFTANGTFLWKTHKRGSIQGRGPGEFWGPSDVAVTPGGDILVADEVNNRIQVLSSSGSYKTEWRSGMLGGVLPVSYDNPFGIDVAQDGTILVADTFNNRIVILNKTGIPQKVIGSRNPVEALVNEFL